ncbi:MAG: hypothetical protein KJO75_09750, partial [Dactylosporangium sp.]|nr:hypothetical protein [Dactylosporangium sp.]
VIADRGIVSVDRDPVSAGPADTDGPVYRPTDGNIPPRAVPPVGDGCGHPELVAPDADSVTARIRPRDQTVDSGGPGAVPRPDADGTTVSGRDGPAPPRPVRGRRSRVVVEPPAFVALDAERWRTAVAVLSRLFARLLADPAFLDGVSRSGSVPEDPPSSVQMPPNPV